MAAVRPHAKAWQNQAGLAVIFSSCERFGQCPFKKVMRTIADHICRVHCQERPPTSWWQPGEMHHDKHQSEMVTLGYISFLLHSASIVPVRARLLQAHHVRDCSKWHGRSSPLC